MSFDNRILEKTNAIVVFFRVVFFKNFKLNFIRDGCDLMRKSGCCEIGYDIAE